MNTGFRDWELKTAEEMWNDMYLDSDNVPHWKSNDHIPPIDMLERWIILGKKFNCDKAVQMYHAEQECFIKNYKEQMKNYVPSEEELFEMRSCFGKGTEVVDIFTGERIIL